MILIFAGILVLVIWFIIQYWWILLILLLFGLAVGVPLWITSVRKANRIKENPALAGNDDVVYTIIKETPLYEERLVPALEFPNPDDQWLFAEKVTNYVGNEYDILYVFPDNTYKESCGLRSGFTPISIWPSARYFSTFATSPSRPSATTMSRFPNR